MSCALVQLLLVSIVFAFLSQTVHSIPEVCDADYESPCTIIIIQNQVLRVVRDLEDAPDAQSLQMIYASINNGTKSPYWVKPNFPTIILDKFGVVQAFGLLPFLSGLPYSALTFALKIVTTPNIAAQTYNAAISGNGAWVEIFFAVSPHEPPKLLKNFVRPATLYDGSVVSVGSSYTVQDPTSSAPLCSALEFKTCAVQAAPALTHFTLQFLELSPTDGNLHGIISQINNREVFLVHGGFYPFIVNISDGGTVVASGWYPDHVGMKWSEIAALHGVKSMDNLDEYLIETAQNGRLTWATFQWLGSIDEADCDKKMFLQLHQRGNHSYYVGVMINDPYPYIEFTDYQVPKTLMNLNIALVAIIGTTFLVISGLFVYEMRSVLIRMSSPLFLIVSMLGGVLLSAVSILYMLFPTFDGDTTICQLRAWLLPAGLSIMISPILAKTYRVSVLIKAMKKVKGLSGLNLTFAAIVLSIPAIIIVAANPKSTISTSVFTSVSEYTYLSQCEDISSMYGLLIAYYALLVAYCFYLAFKIKDAPDGFNEATYIYVACSFLFVYSLLIIPVQFLLDSSPIALSVLRSFGILLGTLVFVGSITFPKVYHIIKGDHNSKELQQKRTYKTGDPGGMSTASGFVHPEPQDRYTKEADGSSISVTAAGGSGNGVASINASQY